MCIAAAALPAVSLAVSVAGTAASMGLGIMQANQQAAIAQQQSNLAAQQANAQVALSQQQMQQQALQQWQSQRMQMNMQRQQQVQQQQQLMAQMEMQRQQQAANMQMQMQQQSANMRMQVQQQTASMRMQMQQTQAQMRLQAAQQQQQMTLAQKQSQDALNLQVIQANAQIANQHKTARQQVINERATIMAKNEADRLTYQKRVEAAYKQRLNNNAAANRVYVAEQAKLDEVKKKAAFEQQALLAKAIGDKGSILATGRTGQSVGLLVNDVERQSGFALAQQAASIDSARDQAIIAMEGGWLEATSANNQAESQIGFAPSTPYLPGNPEKPEFITPIGLGIELFPGSNTK